MIKLSTFLVWTALVASTQIDAQEAPLDKQQPPSGVVISSTVGKIEENFNDKNTLFLDSLRFQEKILDNLTQNMNKQEMLNVYHTILDTYPNYETYPTTKQNQIFIDFVQSYPYIPGSSLDSKKEE